MRRAEALDAFVAKVEPVPSFSGAPVPQLAALRAHLHLAEGRFQAEREQNARAVGADLDAGADLLELARLFVNLDVDAALEQGQRRGEPADAGADDDHMFRRAHGDFSTSRESFCMAGGGLIAISRRMPSPLRSSAEFPPRRKPRSPAPSQF